MKLLKKLETRKKSLLALVLILSLNTLWASTIEPDLVVEKYEEKALLMHLNFQQERDFKISLKDEDQFLLWKESETATKHFSKKISLINLPNGNYFLEIEDGQMITTCQITIENNVLVVSKEPRGKTFKPVVTQKEEKVLLNMFLSGRADTEISIIDSKNNLIYEESIEGKQKIERAFDFSKVQSGNYILQTKTNGRVFVNQIKL